MIQKVNSELVPLTRELARQFAQMKPVPGERPLRASRLKYLESRLQQQRFCSPTWAKALIEGAGGEWRADGQHSSHLLATCEDGLFPSGLSVTVDTYRLDDILELADLFDLFDNPISARSNADKLGIYIADYADLAKLDRAFLGRAARGIDYYCRDLFKSNSKVMVFGAREHGLYFHADGANRDFAVWLYGHRQTKHAWMIGKPGIAAEIYSDWRNHPELADRFWTEVMTERNPDPDDETRELSRTFREWSRKQPRVRQDRFRVHAKKAFDRFRRNSRAKAAPRELADDGGAILMPPPEIQMERPTLSI